MSADEPSSSVRREIVVAFETRKWEFTKRALREGLEAFRRYSENPSDEEIIAFIQKLVESGFPLRRVELHEAPYGEAHELQNADGQGLYIKLKLDWPYVIVMSFHY